MTHLAKGWLGLLALLWLVLPVAAKAAVEMSFYSRELGGDAFPHAFIRLRGTLDATGRRVDASYGFTARSISPAILIGSVPGEVIQEAPRNIARSDRIFALRLTDAEYGRVMAVVRDWRHRPQPSYNLHSGNCVHFVGELAAAAGLRVEYPDALMKRPRAFLQALIRRNPVIAALARD